MSDNHSNIFILPCSRNTLAAPQIIFMAKKLFNSYGFLQGLLGFAAGHVQNSSSLGVDRNWIQISFFTASTEAYQAILRSDQYRDFLMFLYRGYLLVSADGPGTTEELVAAVLEKGHAVSKIRNMEIPEPELLQLSVHLLTMADRRFDGDLFPISRQVLRSRLREIAAETDCGWDDDLQELLATTSASHQYIVGLAEHWWLKMRDSFESSSENPEEYGKKVEAFFRFMCLLAPFESEASQLIHALGNYSPDLKHALNERARLKWPPKIAALP